jgi:hypothetical protein
MGCRGRRAQAPACPWRGSSPVQEGEALLLHRHARVAELLHVVDVRHAPQHLLGTELPQGLKVEVPKVLVPLPRIVVTSSCKAKRPYHLCVENIEAIAPLLTLARRRRQVSRMRSSP